MSKYNEQVQKWLDSNRAKVRMTAPLNERQRRFEPAIKLKLARMGIRAGSFVVRDCVLIMDQWHHRFVSNVPNGPAISLPTHGKYEPFDN